MPPKPHESLRLDHIYIGDVLPQLKKIPSASIRCCVTSPPYWGLRDYDTAAWIGGDSDCNHSSAANIISDATRSTTLTGGLSNQVVSHTSRKMYATVCKKCGASREDLQIGLEPTPEEYIKKMVRIFREVRRILKSDGTLWLNIGDSYWGGKGASGSARPDVQEKRHSNGESINRPNTSIGQQGWLKPSDGKHKIIKPKDLVGIPWMLAFALRDDGWYLRSDVIWSKSNPMPESVRDRPSRAHEYIFLLTKSKHYYYDDIAIRQPLAESVLADARLYNDKYTVGRPDKGFPDTRNDRGGGMLKRKSGNLARKNGTDRGCPDGTSSNVCGSVPWEGMDANKKSVWNLSDNSHLFAWLQGNLTHNEFTTLMNRYLNDSFQAMDVWNISTKPFVDAHFATFPPDLIIDPIRAGTSEYGQCSKCGSPYRRLTEKELLPTAKASPGTIPDSRDHSADKNDHSSNRVKDGHKPGYYNQYLTTGWQPSCDCQDSGPPVPDVVLDPFFGAGTTGVVAKKLLRHFVGVELSADYVKLAVRRLQVELGMFYSPQILKP